MGIHRSARLGLAGRRALVARRRARLLVQGSGETPRRLADGRLQVVAALVGGDTRAAPLARLSRGSLVAAPSLPAAAAGS